MQLRTLLLVAALAACAHGLSEDTYEDKVLNWKSSNSKEQFIRSFNEQHSTKLKGGRADRLYNHILSLFDYKAARFNDKGLTYYLPITHHLSFLPDPIADAVEKVAALCRAGYYKGLEFVHDEALELHHVFFEWMNDSGTVHVLSFLCFTYIGVAFLSWLVNRFTDGIWPSERALARETRRQAEEYLKRKRDL